jgi:hypothetical protein
MQQSRCKVALHGMVVIPIAGREHVAAHGRGIAPLSAHLAANRGMVAAHRGRGRENSDVS